MISDMNKMEIVRMIYLNYIRINHNLNCNIILPKKQGILYNNCINFFDILDSAKVKENSMLYIDELMKYYPSSWCNKVFKRPYLPFNVLVGEKVRNKLVKIIREDFVSKLKLQEAFEFYKKYMSNLDKESAIKLIESGYIGDNEILNKQLCAVINNE